MITADFHVHTDYSDGRDSIDAVCSDAAALAAYRNIVGKYKDLNVCVLLSGFENTTINFSSPEILKMLRDSQKLLFFEDLGGLKLFDLPYALLKKFRRPLSADDAYYISDGECLRVKLPHPGAAP